MTIRNLLYRNSLFIASLLALAIVGQLGLDYFQSKEMKRKEITEEISREISGLVLLTNEWSAFYYERMLKQWRLKQQRIESLVSEEAEYADILSEVEELEENFQALVSTQIQLKQIEDTAQARILNQKLEWLMMRNQIISQTIIDDVFGLSAKVMKNLDSIQNVSTFLYVAFLVLILVIIFTISRRVTARITTPIDALKNEVRKIEKGDYSKGFDLQDKKSHIQSIQDTYFLARAINSMLQTIRDSIVNVEKQNSYIRAILDSIPLGVVVNDLKSDRITYSNSQFEEIFGWTENDISNIKALFEKFRPIGNDGRALKQEFQDFFNNECERSHWENVPVRSQSGEEKVVNIQRIPLSDQELMILTMNDVTHMNKVQAQLQESEKQLTNITNNLPGAVIQYKLDSEGKDELTFVSKGAEKIWGVSAKEAMQDNQKIWAQMDENDKVVVQKSIAHSYQHLSTWKVEWRNILPDRSVRWLQGLGIPKEVGDGVVIWDSLILDVTERKQAEIKIEEYQDSLKELTTELSVSEERQRKEIAANIHDHLSQSLVIAKMRLNDLMRKEELGDYTQEVRMIIKHISEALENSRKITYDLSPPVLYEMGLVETMYWLADNIKESNQLKVDFVSDFEAIEFDEASLILLYRSIQELIYNIIKHAEATRIKIAFRSINNTIEITIRDNGKGFDVSTLEASKRSRKSFGLFAVRERLQNLGGSLVLQSKKGEGTEAKIYVPLELSKSYRYGN